MRIVFHLALTFLLLPVIARGDTYTYPQLVDRMTNLQALAKLPPPGEKTMLASSYDRGSRYDAASDKYINWDANGDGGGIIRQEGNASVLMDVQGPGCIWRVWSATPGEGHVKIYLDGAATPAVDLPFSGYFDGKTPPFNRPNIVYIPSPAARGFDNYTPISFQKSCRIVADKDWGSYYQFTYTLFPAGTVVPTFSMSLSADDSAALDRADKILSQCGQNPVADTTDAKTEHVTGSALPGQTVPVFSLDGPAAITALKVKLDLPHNAEAQRERLRNLTVRITWDGDAAPSVWSPLGDFFGYVGGADAFRSLPTGLTEEGTFYSYWYMPFARKAVIEVGNDGPSPVQITWDITHAPLPQPIATLARFHAKWHRDAFLPPQPDRQPDWTLLTSQGAGRYVGTHLHVWNPRGGWWGEGDDKFFVDGEKFPSSFGTGSEDYFGYAWSSEGHFSRPYHNQILNENNAGHVDDNRWHIPDSVPFQTSVEADIEKYFPDEKPTLYAAEAFWYLSAGGTDPYPALPASERVGYWKVPAVYGVPGVIEGESLKPAVPPAEACGDQDMSNFGDQQWSDGHQLFWRPTEVGRALALRLPEQSVGHYHLFAHYTRAADYGIIQARVDGTNAGEPTDLYAPNGVETQLADLGVVNLPDGAPVLTLTVVAKNPAAKGYFVGLDYLKLVRVP